MAPANATYESGVSTSGFELVPDVPNVSVALVSNVSRSIAERAAYDREVEGRVTGRPELSLEVDER